MRLTSRICLLVLLGVSRAVVCDNPATPPSCNGCVLVGEAVPPSAVRPLCESCISTDPPVSENLPPLCESCVVESEFYKSSESRHK